METENRSNPTFKSDVKMNMNIVKSVLRPWTDKEGNVRYYINDIEMMLNNYRSATDSHLRSYYDWEEMRASGGRVREIIEGNILSKTKVFIDSDGYVNIYGYATAGKGREMKIPELLVKVVRYFYGFCDEETREANRGLIGKSGEESRVGDIVKIVKGRKEVGKVFEVFKITAFSYSRYADPSVYLYAEDGFKVSATNCVIEDVGYSY
ncbi:MAG: hypothetical protein IIY21_04510 [Clostridiales bacterium]|nr:hypothetical protein [Clostridiales bacterium]MBQ1573851.1 hypothetical protein [Clostridiales bacterium]